MIGIEQTCSSLNLYFENLALALGQSLGRTFSVHFFANEPNIYPCYRVSFAQYNAFDERSRENYHKAVIKCLISSDDEDKTLWKMMDHFYETTKFSTERVNQWIHVPLYRNIEEEPLVPIGKARLVKPKDTGFSDHVIKNDDESRMVILNHLLLKYRSR